jgi:NitT/TauT family transport system permease protein
MAVATNAPPVPAVAPSPIKKRKRRGFDTRTFLLAFPVPVLALIFWHMGVTNAWTLPPVSL